MKKRIILGILSVVRMIPVRAVSLRAQIVEAHIVSRETHMLSELSVW